MEKRKRNRWIKNSIVLGVVLLIFIGVAVASKMTQHGQGMDEAWNHLLKEWSKPIEHIGIEEPTMVQSEEVTSYVLQVLKQGNYYVHDLHDVLGTPFPAGTYTFHVGAGELTFQIYEDNMLIDEWTLFRNEEALEERYRYGVELKEGQIIVVIGSGNGTAQSEEKFTVVKELIPNTLTEMYCLEEGSYEIGKDIPSGFGDFWVKKDESNETSLIVSEPGKGGMNITLIADDDIYQYGDTYDRVKLQEGDILQVSGDCVRVRIEREQ